MAVRKSEDTKYLIISRDEASTKSSFGTKEECTSLKEVYRHASELLMKDSSVFSFGIDQEKQKIIVQTKSVPATKNLLDAHIEVSYTHASNQVKEYFIFKEKEAGVVKLLMETAEEENSEAAASNLNATGIVSTETRSKEPAKPTTISFGSPVWFRKEDGLKRCSLGGAIRNIASGKVYLVTCTHTDVLDGTHILFDETEETSQRPVVSVCRNVNENTVDVTAIELDSSKLKFQGRYAGQCIILKPAVEEKLNEMSANKTDLQKLSNLQQCHGRIMEFPHSRRVGGQWRYRNVLLLNMSWKEGDSGTLVACNSPPSSSQFEVVGMVIAGCQDDQENAEILATPFYYIMQTLESELKMKLNFLNMD